MANRKDTTKEALLDEAERLWIMGLRKPYQLMKKLDIGNWQTANEYCRIAAKRATRRNKAVNKAEQFRNQLNIYDQIIRELWTCYMGSTEEKNINGAIGALNAITRVLRNKAELLGLTPQQFPISDIEGTVGPDLLDLLEELPDDRARDIVDSLNMARQSLNTKMDNSKIQGKMI